MVVAFSLLAGNALAQSVSKDTDSTGLKQKKRSNLKLNTRLNSLGFFNFSGRLCSENPAFDFTLYYDRKSWGAMTFSATDIYDQRSDNNFVLSLVYTKVKIGGRLTVTPHSGVSFEDWGREKGDRHIIITALKVNPRVQVDHTMLFANILARHNREWVNRIRMLYSIDEHLALIVSTWHNNKVFDEAEYFSCGLNATYNRIKISKQVTLNTGVTALVMADTNDEEMFPKKNGIVFTIGAILD